METITAKMDSGHARLMHNPHSLIEMVDAMERSYAHRERVLQAYDPPIIQQLRCGEVMHRGRIEVDWNAVLRHVRRKRLPWQVYHNGAMIQDFVDWLAWRRECLFPPDC